MKKFLFALMLISLVNACNQQNKSGNGSGSGTTQVNNEAEHAAAIDAIMKADSAWDQASAAKSADGWLSFYADDALMMPPGQNICTDKASRLAAIKGMFATPGVSLRFQMKKAEVAASNDLGYGVGVYQWTSKDPKGKDYHETGKFCETWKKQADGSWKCIVDIWNADAPQ